MYFGVWWMIMNTSLFKSSEILSLSVVCATDSEAAFYQGHVFILAMAFRPVDRKNWAQSSTNLGATVISLFETGDFYDCTFKVGNERTGHKSYKCHKAILSVASVVFETMFFGNFKEAYAKADESIWLREVSSETFESAMRFAYGREKQFKDTSLAVQVFRFAHEMQMDLLVEEAEKFIVDSLKAADVFAAFELFKFFNKQDGLQKCKNKILKYETEQALASESWLNMRQDSVLDFLQMDFMEVKEPDLVRALMKWGRAQVNQDGEDPEDGQKLRPKILPCLKFVNFHMLSNREFALLCLEDLGRVLSGDEKHAVMMCISLGDWNHMPGELAPVKQPRRLKSTCVVELLYQGREQGQIRFQTYCGLNLTIELDRSAKLVGFQLDITPEKAPTIAKAFQSFNINLHHPGSDAVVGSGCSKEMFTYEGKEYYKMTSMHQMEAGVTYTLSLELDETIQIYSIPYVLEESPISFNSNAHGQLRISLHSKSDHNWCAAKITELVFELL